MKLDMTPFWIALQFLTTFPIQLKAMPSKQQNGQSLLFYPVVGAIIGLILFIVAILLQAVPIILTTVLLLVFWIWLTGGLHLDGLADSADAWVGGFGDKERTLKIMKDPSCGPIGVLSLLMICSLKGAALYVLLQQQHYTALILCPILARLAPLILFLTTPYVREKGLGSHLADNIPRVSAMLICLGGIVVASYFSWVGVLTIILSTSCLFYLRYKCIQRIDGVTGDTIGASIEIVETLALFSFVLLSIYLPVAWV